MLNCLVTVFYLERHFSENSHAKQNKVRKTDSQTSQSDEIDLKSPNTDPRLVSFSEPGRDKSSSVCSHVTDNMLDIGASILETCLDESETAATDESSSTRKSMGKVQTYTCIV